MKRPLIWASFGRSWARLRGWSFVLIIAPCPDDEQEPGHLVKALLNAEVHLCLRPLRLSVSAYSFDPAMRPAR